MAYAPWLFALEHQPKSRFQYMGSRNSLTRDGDSKKSHPALDEKRSLRVCSYRRSGPKMQAIISENRALPRTQDTGMLGARPSVLVVDDDPEFRDSVARLLRSVDLETRHFSSVADFLKADLPDGPTCLVLDVRLPGQSGLELQRELAAADRQIPIIFITAHADVPMTVQAMKGGAIEFLTKPFRDQELLDAVDAGLMRDRVRRERDKALGELRERFETLSSREREIMFQVTAGRLNKQIAHEIGIAESTVKVHRTNLMRKMKARSLPELSRMADTLRPMAEKPQRP
jgi:FixJ family two-component response regulator